MSVFSLTLRICFFSLFSLPSPGLWNFCNKTHCMALNDPYVGQSMAQRPTAPKWLKQGETPQWLKACQAAIILAAIFQFVGLVSATLMLFVKKVRGFVASIFNAGTFTFLLIAVYVYADRTQYFIEEYRCGVGWGLGFLSVITSFLSAFIGFCIF